MLGYIISELQVTARRAAYRNLVSLTHNFFLTAHKVYFEHFSLECEF